MYGFGMMYGWVVFFLLIGVLVYFFNQRSCGDRSDKSAQDILDERYAKGEISEQEYEEKSKNLEKR